MRDSVLYLVIGVCLFILAAFSICCCCCICCRRSSQKSFANHSWTIFFLLKVSIIQLDSIVSSSYWRGKNILSEHLKNQESRDDDRMTTFQKVNYHQFLCSSWLIPLFSYASSSTPHPCQWVSRWVIVSNLGAFKPVYIVHLGACELVYLAKTDGAAISQSFSSSIC